MNSMFFRRHYEFMAKHIGPLLSMPVDVEVLADMLEKDNPSFKRGIFVSKALEAWEERNIPEDIE